MAGLGAYHIRRDHFSCNYRARASGRSLPGNDTPALIGVWALFIPFAVVSLRGSAILMIYATVLATLGLGMHLFAQPIAISSADVPLDLGPLFQPERNALRLALLASTGLVLAISVLRAKQTLSRATSLARERANLSSAPGGCE
jgi:hypothetical protein